jgi:hypothetical protein
MVSYTLLRIPPATYMYGTWIPGYPCVSSFDDLRVNPVVRIALLGSLDTSVLVEALERRTLRRSCDGRSPELLRP